MDAERIQIAANLLGGQASIAWRTRAAHLFERITHVYEVNPRSLPMVPVSDDPTGNQLGFTRILGTDRSQVQRTARSLIGDFFTGELPQLAEHLEENIWVTWPTGRLGRHPSAQLGQALIPKKDKANFEFQLSDWRVYHFGEFKQILLRELGAVFDAVLDLKSAVIVTTKLESADLAPVRILLAFHRDERGQFKARNLPFVSPDDAYVASRKLSASEDTAAKTAESWVRTVALGQWERMNAHQGQLCPQVWFADESYSQSALFLRLTQKPLFPSSTETAFDGSQLLAYEQIQDFISPSIQQAFESSISDTNNQAIHELSPQLVVTQVGEYDPKHCRIRRTQSVKSVVFCFENPQTGHQAYKIGGIFL